MVNEALAPDGDAETVYTLQDGALVPSYECSLGETTLSCSQDGAFVFSIADNGWLTYPLPDGKVVDATPSGWWVVQGDQVVPADKVAGQYAQGAVSMDEFLAIATEGGSPWPPTLMGFGWEFVWAAVAVVGVGVAAFVFWRRGRRAA